MLIPSTSVAFSFHAEQLFLNNFLSYVKPYLLDALRDGIRSGSLRVVDGNVNHLFGEWKTDKPTAEILVINSNFWLRVFMGHDLGFSEAYMHGDFETPSLKAILNLWLDNRAHLQKLSSLVSRSISAVSAVGMRFFGQSLSNAKLNVMTGYDCSNDFFKSFLSEDMMYSCALWTDDEGGVKGDLTDGPFPGDLEAAQLKKVHHVLRQARVRPGDRVLEFGSGWGTMAIEAAKLGCTVDTLTLSVPQKAEAEARLKALGLDSRVTVHLMDYRKLPPSFEHAFDAFVSIEMVEHVGIKYHNELFKILDWALKPERAAACITCTTTPEWRYTTYQAVDYARKYQWPNAFCPSPTAFVGVPQAATPGRFALESVEDHTHHYPRTLREWGRRFQKNWGAETIASLLKEQPQLAEGNNLQIFKRKWEYLYVYAEIGFARAYTSVHCFTFVRPECIVAPCD